MRKLVYLGVNKDGDYLKTYSYEVKEQNKNEYTFKIVFEDVEENLVWNCYKGEKLEKTVNTIAEERQAFKDGYIIKPAIVERVRAFA